MKPVIRVGLVCACLVTFLQASPDLDWRRFSLDAYPEQARAQIAAAREAALQSPTSADAVGQLALVFHAWEQFDLAAQVYAEARRLAPTDVAWWALSGGLSARTGRHDLAAEYYGRAVALAPTPILRLRHADALLDSQQLDAARAAYERAVTIPEAEPAAHYGLGRVDMAQGRADAARAHFERAVAIVPTFGAAHYALAQLQYKSGDKAGARASLARQQQCLACWPVPNDPWTTRLDEVRTDAAAIMRRGVQAAGTGQEDARAIALHEESLARNPALLQARVNLITLYARTGNLEKAEAHYRAVVASGTQLAEAHQAWGLALATTGHADRAEPVLRQAIEGNPLNAGAHNALGLICESTGRIAEAEASFGRAVAADPRTRGYRFNLVRVLFNAGRLDEALANLSLMTAPDDAESVRYLLATSTALLRKGDVAGGRGAAQDALERARRLGLTDLVATIERELQKFKE